MPNTNITPENLRAQAALGGDSLREFILGEGKNRADRVARATEALRLFRAEMQGDSTEQRKTVVDTTRVILQESLEEIRAELTDADPEAKKTLETELLNVDQAKGSALKEERAMATTTEFVAAEGREALNDLRHGGVANRLTYAGVTAGAAAAGAWIWNKTVGRVLSWFRSDSNKATWIERIGTFLGASAGAVLGMLGVRRFAGSASKSIPQAAFDALGDAAGQLKKQVMDSPAGQAIDGTVDTGSGVVKQLSETGAAVFDVGKRDTELVVKIGQEAASDPLNAMKTAVTEGLPLMIENGTVAVWIMGKAIALPGLSLAKTIQWISTGEKPEDYWLVWGEAGVAYVLGKSAFNLLVNGKLDLPNVRTRSGIAMTAMRLAAGPLEAAYDAFATGGRMLTQDGRMILRIQAQRTVPGRVAAWLSKPSIGSEADVAAAIDDWRGLERDADFMERYGQKDGDVFSQKDVKEAKSSVRKRLAQIQKALARMQPSSSDTPALARLKATATIVNTDAEFAKEMNNYMISSAVEASGATSSSSASARERAYSRPVTVDSSERAIPAAPPVVPAAVSEQSAPSVASDVPQRVVTPGSDLESDLTLEPLTPRPIPADVVDAVDRAIASQADAQPSPSPAVRRTGSDGASLGRGPDDGGTAGAVVNRSNPRGTPPDAAVVIPSGPDPLPPVKSGFDIPDVDGDFARVLGKGSSGKKIGIGDGGSIGSAAADARRSGIDVRTGVDTDQQWRADADASIDTKADTNQRIKFKK